MMEPAKGVLIKVYRFLTTKAKLKMNLFIKPRKEEKSVSEQMKERFFKGGC